jgi:hypothetical protein
MYAAMNAIAVYRVFELSSLYRCLPCQTVLEEPGPSESGWQTVPVAHVVARWQRLDRAFPMEKLERPHDPALPKFANAHNKFGPSCSVNLLPRPAQSPHLMNTNSYPDKRLMLIARQIRLQSQTP